MIDETVVKHGLSDHERQWDEEVGTITTQTETKEAGYKVPCQGVNWKGEDTVVPQQDFRFKTWLL